MNEELKQAAKYHSESHPYGVWKDEAKDSFRCGAEWMLKKAVEAYCLSGCENLQKHLFDLAECRTLNNGYCKPFEKFLNLLNQSQLRLCDI